MRAKRVPGVGPTDQRMSCLLTLCGPILILLVYPQDSELGSRLHRHHTGMVVYITEL